MPPPRPVPPALRGRPFTTAQALAAGLTLRALTSRQYQRLFRDVYLEAAVEPTLEVRARGLALLMPPGCAFSRHTAAALWELPVPADPLLHVSVPSAADRPTPRRGVRWHEAITGDDTLDWLGIPVATPERTFVDLSEDLQLDALVVLGDAMLRRLTRPDLLAAAVARASRRRGVVRARAALPLLRERVDSPMESRTRWTLVTAGLPCPEVNVPLHDDASRFLGTGDLVYRAAKIVIEYEGDQHRTDRQQWRYDLARYERFRDAGWLVIRVTADDVLGDPAAFIARVRRHLAERTPRV